MCRILLQADKVGRRRKGCKMSVAFYHILFIHALKYIFFHSAVDSIHSKNLTWHVNLLSTLPSSSSSSPPCLLLSQFSVVVIWWCRRTRIKRADFFILNSRVTLCLQYNFIALPARMRHHHNESSLCKPYYLQFIGINGSVWAFIDNKREP